MKQLLLFIALTGLISSCSKRYEDMDQLGWLQGKWSSDIQGKNMLEEWVRLNDSTIMGHSYFMEGTDTILGEKMTIATRLNTTYFQTVISQKGKENVDTTRFEMAEIEEGKIVFENLFHDFPQRIVYTHPSKDSIWAYLDGELMGNYERIDFKMKKRK